jgi:hypothetical protein
VAKTNKTKRGSRVAKTHEGGRGVLPTGEQELRRILSTCLLFEKTFYEGGNSLASRLGVACEHVSKEVLISESMRSKHEMHLRHAPLWAACHLTRLHKGADVGNTISSVIVRADEPAEIISMYWKMNGKKAPLSKQLKLGIADALTKFDEYQLAKWDRPSEISLRDVIFMTHPGYAPGKQRPTDDVGLAPAVERSSYKRGATSRHENNLLTKLIMGELKTPDTWEVALSAIPKDDKEKRVAEWTRLLSERRLGALALLRNLRNMDEDGVDDQIVSSALRDCRAHRILPYQLLAAYKFAPAFGRDIEDVMLRGMEGFPQLDGKTCVVVDVSGSMDWELAGRSKMNRMDAACGLAIMLSEMSHRCRVFTFSNSDVEVPQVRGFGLMDAIINSQHHGGTYLGKSLQNIDRKIDGKGFNRMIVITDEQAHDRILPMKNVPDKYLLNVAPYKVGLNTEGGWVRINGFSTSVAEWIAMEESERLFS